MSENYQKPLLIEVNAKREEGVSIKITEEANELLENVARATKRSKRYIASKMIEYAYKYIQYEE